MTEKINELERLIMAGDCVVFVGSGLSASNYPSWAELIKTLCEECGVEYPSKDNIDSDEYLKLADDCYNNNSNAYHEVLKNIFSMSLETTPLSYRYLIKVPFKSFVTINFDPLLAENSREIGSKIFTHRLGLDTEKLKGNVFYIHGYVEVGGNVEDEQLVLTNTDFEREYDPSGGGNIHDFLMQLFKYKTVLFIGCSLSEPPLKRLLHICQSTKNKIHERSGDTPPKHYILLANEVDKEADDTDVPVDVAENISIEKWYEDSGISVVMYDKSSADHSHYELTRLLEKWSGLPKAVAISPYNTGGPSL